MVRRAASALMVLVCVFFIIPTAPVPALAAVSTGSCSLTIQLNLRPGLTLSSQSGTIFSDLDRLAGTMNCVGVINGGIPTGQGRFAVHGTYQGSCLQGTTSGTAPFEIPTTRGRATGTAIYTVVWAGNVGEVTASGANYGFAPGPFEFLPRVGNCTTLSPLSVIAWQGLQLVFQS